MLCGVYDIVGYQPIESEPRKKCKPPIRRCSFLHKGRTYSLLNNIQSEIECLIINIPCDDGIDINVCGIYRPETNRINTFLSQNEELLSFLKTLKGETILFGGCNNDTLKADTDKKRYEPLLTAYDSEIQNTLPTRVTSKTKSCPDHMITKHLSGTKTFEKTISDHHTVLLEIPKKRCLFCQYRDQFPLYL